MSQPVSLSHSWGIGSSFRNPRILISTIAFAAILAVTFGRLAGDGVPAFDADSADDHYSSPSGSIKLTIATIHDAVRLTVRAPSGGRVAIALPPGKRDWFADWDADERLWVNTGPQVVLVSAGDVERGVPARTSPPTATDWMVCPKSFASLRH